MARSGSITALEADPNDRQDFDVPAEGVAQALAERRRRFGGRPRGSDKEQVSLRLDKDILAHSRDDGTD